MFSKKSFIGVSAIQEEESIKSIVNQPQVSSFPSSFYFDLKENKDNIYAKKSLQKSKFYNNQAKVLYQRNIKTQQDHLDNWNTNFENNFFSGQSFRNVEIEQTNQKFNYDSMKRQYETRYQKQKQFYQLKQWKYQQEIQNLKVQISILTNKIEYKQREMSQSTIVQTPSNSRLTQAYRISDGPNEQFNMHLKKMLKRVQKEHEQCIQTKKQLLTQIQNFKLKLKVSQERIKTLQQQLIQKKQKIKQVSSKSQGLNQKVLIQKAKWENQEKNTTKIMQQLQMRMDQCKYQNQALKRQLNLNNKKSIESQSKQDRALKILNNSFSFVDNQVKYSLNNKSLKHSIKKQDFSSHLSGKPINNMYNKSVSFFKVQNGQNQYSLGCIRDKFRKALQPSSQNKCAHSMSFQQKCKKHQFQKQNYSKSKEGILRFKYL